MSENNFANENTSVGEIVSKEQLSKITKTHKRKLTYLIDNKILPCTKTNKKTRCYQIKKEDALDFINNTEKYLSQIPRGALSSKESVRTDRIYYSTTPFTAKEIGIIYKHVNKILANYKDLLTTKEISIITGLNVKTVIKWIHDENITAFRKGPSYYIPKKFFLEYVTTQAFYKIIARSVIYYNFVSNIYKVLGRPVYKTLEEYKKSKK